MNQLIFISLAVTLVYYSYLSYEDWKTREISSKAFYLMIPITAAVNFIYYELNPLPTLVNLAVGLISFIMIFVLSALGLMGRGDAFIVSYVFLLNPFPILFFGIPIFPGFIATAFSFFLPLFIIMMNIIINFRRKQLFNNLTSGMTSLRKAYYFIFGEVMSKEEFFRKKFYFPLVSSSIRRLHANVEIDPLYPEKYKIDDSYIIASFGVPLATGIFIGYLFFSLLLFSGAVAPLL
ncbi:MAG: hypothetical protein QW326_05655 [Fervidicoccaceae archaeon]